MSIHTSSESVADDGHSTSAVAQPLAYEALPEAAPSGGAAVMASTSPLLAVKTRLEVCVGETQITVGELLAVRDGHVLKLNRNVDQPVDVRLDGKVVARGVLVAVGDCFAVRLTELPAPLVP